MADPKQDRGLRYILALGFVLLAFFAVSLYLKAQPDAQKHADQQMADDALFASVLETAPVDGAANASLLIVEFGDFQCPSCKEVSGLVTQAMAQHPGKVRRAWIHAFNKDAHPESENAAIASQCASHQGSFWPYHDLLYKQQENLSTLLYNQIAQTLKLDMNAFRSCLADPSTRDTVRAHAQLAVRLGITDVPHLLINNHPIEGAITLDKINAMLNQ